MYDETIVLYYIFFDSLFFSFSVFLVGDGPFLKIFILGPTQNEKLNLYPQKVATFQKTYLQKVATFWKTYLQKVAKPLKN